MAANGFRAVGIFDPLHKAPRDLYWAAKASGNWSMVLDTTFAINFYAGPFKTKSHWHQAREAADDYVNKASVDDVLLLFCYEDVVREEGPLPGDVGPPRACAFVIAVHAR